MSLGLLALGAVDPILDDSWTGWDYANNAVRVALLSDGTGAGNEVLQQSGLGNRQAQLKCFAEDADALLLRGYYEGRDLITFTDYDGSTCSVRIFDFARQLKGPVWEVTMTLLQYTEPVVAS